MTVHNDLTGHSAGLGQAKTIDYVVKTQFQEAQQVLTGNAAHVGCFQVVAMELLLQHAIHKLDLLLFLQLGTILGNLLALVAARVPVGMLLIITHNNRGNTEAPAFLCNGLFIVRHFALSSLQNLTRGGASADGIRCAGWASRL